MSILDCKKLNIGYNDKSVCKDITFSVDSGEYVCIIGENGCGKSTLIKTILGLNKQLGGKIVFNKDFNKSIIGYLPQQTDLQKDFPATVNEIVMSGFLSKMKFRPFYKKSEKQQALGIMKFLGIDELQKKSYRELSGGQQQKVLLARAMCSTQDLLVLDEPTNGLDARAIKRFYELLAEINKEGTAIIMVTHNIEKVIKYATKIIYLKNTPEFIGSKEEFLKTDYAKMLNLEDM